MTDQDAYGGPEIWAAMAEFQKRAPVIKKAEVAEVESQRANFKYTFAGLTKVWEAIEDLMNELGLLYTAASRVRDIGGGQTRLVLEATVIHVPSGQRITADFPIQADSPQKIGSAMTFGRRYCLASLMNLRVVDDDDDAKKASEQEGLTPSQIAQGGPRKAAQRTQRPARPRSAPPPVEEDAPAPVPNNPGGPMSEQTRKKVFASVGDLDYTTREQRMEFVNRVLARHQAGPVGSSNDLTQEQAGWVIEAAEAEVAGPPMEPGQPAEGEG